MVVPQIGHSGLERLKKLKKELETFYKGIIKVLFSGSVDNDLAV